VGGFLAAWVIGYGGVQSLAPIITRSIGSAQPDGRSALGWAIALTITTAGIALALTLGFSPAYVLLLGLAIFALVFAVNSSLHSYLIVSYARADGAAMDVGFYYMANALGRLLGTLLSGWVYQAAGLGACLWVSAGMLGMAALLSVGLPFGVSASEK
jgi:predicted MFS family arabinose efflux permease